MLNVSGDNTICLFQDNFHVMNSRIIYNLPLGLLLAAPKIVEHDQMSGWTN